MNNPREVEIRGGKVICFFRCSSCGEEAVVVVSADGYINRVVRGWAVQKAFPDLPIAEREMFVSGTCGKCFEEMRREEAAYEREIEEEAKANLG